MSPAMASRIPTPYSADPPESSLPPSSGRISDLNADMQTTATTAMGTITKNRLCHPKASFRRPPTTGPAARPMYTHMVCSPMAPPLCSGG